MNLIPSTFTLLGTGTSQGVPVIGCDCEICRSSDPRDNRLRTAALISAGDLRIAIDIGPDFRQQMLRAGVSNLHAVLLTHEHNDHVMGLDEVRPFNFFLKKRIPIYADERVQRELRQRFSYVFEENPYPGAPMIDLLTISKNEKFTVEGIHFTPVEVMHGELPILGFRIGDLTYLTDVKTIAEAELEKIQHSKILVISALHHEAHPSHTNLEEALALVERIQPERTYLTHMSHRMGLHSEISKKLPPGVEMGYDGLTLSF